jgi:hypothetical protein
LDTVVVMEAITFKGLEFLSYWYMQRGFTDKNDCLDSLQGAEVPIRQVDRRESQFQTLGHQHAPDWDVFALAEHYWTLCSSGGRSYPGGLSLRSVGSENGTIVSLFTVDAETNYSD